MNANPGDMFLVSGASIEDRLIQFAQRRRDQAACSIWSHVAVVIAPTNPVTGDTRLIEAAGRAGVRYASISDYAHVHTQLFPVVASDAQRAAAVAVAKSKLGCSYDWSDLIGIGLNLLIGDPFVFHSANRKLICSWLASLCLEAEGYTLPRDSSDMSPGDVAWLLTPKPPAPKGEVYAH